MCSSDARKERETNLAGDLRTCSSTLPRLCSGDEESPRNRGNSQSRLRFGCSLRAMTLEHDRPEQMAPIRPAVDGSDIRKLTAGEVPRITRALARAFEDDPVTSWIFARDTDRVARLEKAF